MKKIKVGPKVTSIHSKPKKKREGTQSFKVGKTKTEKLIAEPVDDEKTKKKLKQVSRQLVALGGGSITTKDVKKAMAENFGESAPKIIDMLEMNDNDGAMMLLKKRLLQSSIAMLTHAEKLMTDTQGAKGTYQYATLVSQIRELITDIQADRDRSFIANQLIDQTLMPAFIDLAEMVMNEHQAFRKEMMDDEIIQEGKQLRFNTALRDLARSMAQKMQAKYKDISFKIMQQLTS